GPIAESKGEAEGGDAEVLAEGLGPHSNHELEPAPAGSAGPHADLRREPEQVEGEVLEVGTEDVSERHGEQSVQVGENRPVPAQRCDEGAAIEQSAGKKAGEGLVASERDQLGEGDGLAPQRIDEGRAEAKAEHAGGPGDVPVALDRGGVADPGLP